MKFALNFDLRNPSRLAGSRSFPDLYAETLELIESAEALGYDAAWFTEHHFVPEDGYLPSPLVLCAATAARTRRIGIGTGVLLAPFYHPVRLAEDCAVLDNLSNGRFMLGPAIGFKPDEFAGYGVDRRRRGRLTDEILEIVIRCWTEDGFDFDGEFFRLRNVRVYPTPVQKPRPQIWVGGVAPAGIRRAARFGDGIIATYDLRALYAEALAAAGKDSTNPQIASSFPWIFTSPDPERDWQALKASAHHQLGLYCRWGIEAGEPVLGDPPVDDADLERRGHYFVGTPDQVFELLKAKWLKERFTMHWNIPLWPGVPAALAARSIELFAREVMPRLRSFCAQHSGVEYESAIARGTP
jgi:alkanesulfonate monooxygenase SsuD/methylene tetrahydromethanopterin reductase-like flavin-dependent oxidoreductase (luciferase family)